MNEPVVFDQEALKKRVSESVSASFGMLIPQEQWQALIDKEVKAFFETEQIFELVNIVKAHHWNGTAETWALKIGMTPFRQMVWKKVSELCTAEIEKVLTSEAFMGHIPTAWQVQDGSAKLNEVMEAKLHELAPKMAAEFFRSGFVAALSGIKDQVKQEIRENR